MSLDGARRAFADEIGAVAHLESLALVDAFARVPREAFLGPGPWQILRAFDLTKPYRLTVDDDPRHIYHDVGVAIDAARLLNNGQPSALARWIEAAAIGPGDSVMHIGCGVGYYTAILAELAGGDGRVLACEIDPELAARARHRLGPWPNVEVEASDGSAPRGSFDAIFVNAGATHARPEWLAALRPHGRLLLPLTVHVPGIPLGVGVMIRVDRGEDSWPARLVSQGIGIYDCANARDPAHEVALMALGNPAVAARLRAVSIDSHPPADACLVHIEGFCLQS